MGGLNEGDVLAGKYRVEKLLGEGGMGSVYIATNTMLERKVALKVMSDAFARVPEAVQRFTREAVAASRVSHPSIVQVFDAGQHEGNPWIAMELLEGESLGERLTRGPLSLDEVVQMATGTLSALAEVHEQGIVHRDLKPDNIFLAKDRSGGFVPKVLDFGVAKDTSGEQLNKLTATGAVVGTAYYLSPEQAKGSTTIDARADVYAMGVVLFECLSGDMPYEADTITQLIAKMFTEPPRLLSHVAPNVPSPIADVVTACLQQNPDHRYQSARDLLAGLEQAVGVVHGSSPGVAGPLAYAGTMQGQGSPSRPGLAHTPAPHSQPGFGTAGTAAGHLGGGQLPSSPGAPHSMPGSSPGVPPGSSPGVGPGSQPGVPPGSYPGASQPGYPMTNAGAPSQPGSMQRTAFLAPSAAPAASMPGHAPAPSQAEPGGGGKMGLVALVAVVFLVGAAVTGGVGWFVMSDDGGGDAVAQADQPPTDTAAPPEVTPEDAPEVLPDAPTEATEEPIEAAPEEPAEVEADEPEADDGDDHRVARRGRRARRAEEPAAAAAPEPEPEPAAPPEPAPAATNRVAPAPRPPPRPSRGLSPAQINSALAPRMNYAQQRCFERRRRRVRDLGGIVTVGFTVAPNGRAQNVQVIHNGSGDEWYARCLSRVVAGTRFPPASNGQATPARYPFNFR